MNKVEKFLEEHKGVYYNTTTISKNGSAKTSFVPDLNKDGALSIISRL